MFRRPARRLPLLLFVVAVAAAAAFLLLRGAPRGVATAMPERGTAIEAVYATGTVEPEIWARIGPVTTGRIAEVLAREGDTVRVGQPLARLDDREALARVAELEARAAYWREELARTRALAERGIKAREAEQKAQSEYNQVVAAINAARQRRADLVVTSPIAGMVLRRDGEPGEVATPETALFWVGEPRPLRITADVDEEDIARVRPGQRVLVKADAFPDGGLEGSVDRVTPKGDPVNKTFRVRVRLPDDTPLMTGMTTEINIVTAEHKGALLVPAGAVADRRVMVVAGGTAASRAVTLGIRGRDRIEVISGLDEGEIVIVNPPAGLKPGDRVKTE
ncbi:efflux RND transporter periplasmic adaptor subunit [Magnetospirillum sp. UT-4]|uniref:efflux RND transporter periplasmic adaptor subunit n=1 Tax=Magnetospirillum sp. UT-4 TaxID=2681467 RepID=UPI00137D72CA|nr:efflux RND transporter periplasmic adaptor subunit [Magnetospirillum sp. UT-4]CAA7626504.1 putative Secretion protein HlyD [Magnetospirillum sp. UT-4]